ncbi:Uncharacterised protein [Serratia fonticola]|uniref:Uncharacterized protein n=1 Tax=Serratia fonticola TaxID=47917 RepID=A0A4U9UCB8_SERFO|nr:Uncharacterised protein [Serratia fonticola]
MKPRIVIAIQDSNRYFAQGIQHILQDYLQAKRLYGGVLSRVTSEIAIDLDGLCQTLWLVDAAQFSTGKPGGPAARDDSHMGYDS